MFNSTTSSLNSEQAKAFDLLMSDRNIFLTGAAGSGKSYLIQKYLKSEKSSNQSIHSAKKTILLASTGAAAILIGGRTFHSFFGIGILEGGPQATLERAIKHYPLRKRLLDAETIVLDEISMISGPAFQTAEKIACAVRGNTRPWGGLRMIVVGDFAQLPPVNRFSNKKEWSFLETAWGKSEFHPVILNEIVRTKDKKFLEVLNFVRNGIVNEQVKTFLNERIGEPDDFVGTRLFSRREDVERFNLIELEKIKNEPFTFETYYTGKSQSIEDFKKHAPISESITLKEDALVMLRQNDLEGRWVNGSLGYVREITADTVTIELLNESVVDVERTDFTLLDAEGKPVVTANNFPLSLAYAVTIHKAQGATIDSVMVDLKNLWEPGQAYVALSRAKKSSRLKVKAWNARSFLVDPIVQNFYSSLSTSTNLESSNRNQNQRNNSDDKQCITDLFSSS